jgi:ATP-dependent DNA helicase RecG
MKDWTAKAKVILKTTLTAPRMEQNELDWKFDLSPDKTRLTQHLSAFANYPGGGFLVFGLSVAGDPVGLDDAKANAILGSVLNCN